jgi:hypothetical protein
MKKESMFKRNAEMVKVKAVGKIKNIEVEEEIEKVYYEAHFRYLIKHKDTMYIEEEVEERVADFYKGVLIEDYELPLQEDLQIHSVHLSESTKSEDRGNFVYDRLRAVKYAELWWNDFNPAYVKFDVDCTNFISQCLHAGDAPMRGYPNRGSGWWMMQKSWSYSWTVANALRWYLPGAKLGLRGKEVSSPEKLSLGDVICYDFQGDGRFDHTTIVTAKDGDGMPLVNAHTFNCRMRYWAYEDSTAYTPNIKYKFFHILDDQ